MDSNVLLGVFLIGLGAFSSGSFAVPFGKIKGWHWESYWMVFSVGAYILFPLAACLVFSPQFILVVRSTSSSTLLTVFLLGSVYGIGNLSFGLALRYLGLSLGYALSLGLMLAIGTLVPPLIDGRLQVMMQGNGGTLLISGILVACAGIAVSAWSGFLKEKMAALSRNPDGIGEFNLTRGVMSAILVGFTGSAMSMGFEQGLPLSEMAALRGVDPLFTIMPVLVVLFAGTFVTTLGWCVIYLGRKNNSLKDYTSAASSATLTWNYLFGFLAGFLWFGQFIVYGMGKSKMGPFTFTSWGILMALTIVFATIWGILRKEWKGAPSKAYVLMIVSLVIIISASFMIGISGSM